nr:unnamed protein product [Leishmania braziliensis]
MMLFCCTYLRFVCLALNIAGAITLCVVWVAMVRTYTGREGPRCLLMESLYSYGPGVVLLLVAWALNILNITTLLLPCPGSDSSESGKGTENRG